VTTQKKSNNTNPEKKDKGSESFLEIVSHTIRAKFGWVEPKLFSNGQPAVMSYWVIVVGSAA